MDTKVLQNLRKSLPRGSRLQLSKTTGYSIKHIDRVLHGTRFNQMIVDEAIILGEKKLREIV